MMYKTKGSDINISCFCLPNVFQKLRLRMSSVSGFCEVFFVFINTPFLKWRKNVRFTNCIIQNVNRTFYKSINYMCYLLFWKTTEFFNTFFKFFLHEFNVFFNSSVIHIFYISIPSSIECFWITHDKIWKCSSLNCFKFA